MEIEILTPTKKILQAANAKSVALHTTGGYVCILEDHSPLVATVSLGEVLVQTTEGAVSKILIDGGLLSVKENKVQILASRLSDSIEELNVEDVETRLAKLEKEVAQIEELTSNSQALLEAEIAYLRMTLINSRKNR